MSAAPIPRELESLNSIPPTDRFCDLVMKGGVTSGVVYPPAICKLAERYRFKNIGGTSAGAIAAAITAAAELCRRRNGSMNGFALVAGLPAQLKQTLKGKSRLLRLFQPDTSCRRLFRILMTSLNAQGTYRRIAAILLGCIMGYWPAVIASALLSTYVWFATDSTHAGLLLLLGTLPAFVGLCIYWDITRNVVGNNYGLCKGMTTIEENGPALTPWLHQMIQDAAGLPLQEPLTFGHLWAAPGGPAPSPGSSAPIRSINLEMFTTNLSHGRPYIFPHVESTARLFFNPDELASYLPPDVMQWFNNHARPYAPNPLSPSSDPDPAKARVRNLLEIPLAEHFPVLLAARMSLSFPALFAAVPLWAIDYQHPVADRDFQRCLFSDGGISSNFPIHLFDGLVPQWPTFGIDLEPQIDDLPGRTFLPKSYLGGIADRWSRFDQAKKSASRMGGFLMSIANTMQNWNDNTQARSAGTRDRVVRVRLEKDEGGMNLNMPGSVIDDVAKRGAEAADKLTDRFLGPGPSDGWDGWSTQRWVRLDTLVYALSQKIAGLRRALQPDLPHSVPLDELIEQAKTVAPPGHETPLTDAQAEALANLITALDEVADKFQASAPRYPNEPLPPPEISVRPPL